MGLFSLMRCVALAACLAAVCGAQTGVAELKIEVRDASGAAVARVSGTLHGVETQLRRAFRTDAQGLALVRDLAPGRYQMRVAKDGFAAFSRVIELSGASETRTVTLSVGGSSYEVNVVGATPLGGLDRTVDEVPAPVQTANARDIEQSGALDLSDFLNRRMSSVYLNEIQGNPLQPDLNYRGFTASPLLGTPQGISIYMDGVRLNQPFGDVVSWDLIPRIAIAESVLIPGSNPLFGLNTLGGAVSLQTKDGVSHPGTQMTLGGGSFARKNADLEHGGSLTGGFNWFVAGNFLFEDGWRDSSPSNVRQLFGRLGRQSERTSIGLGLSYANNALIGNGLQEFRLLRADHASIYTKPDSTLNRSPFLNLTLRHAASNRLQFSGNAYFRHIRTRTLNGDINEESLDQSLYQPNGEEIEALRDGGYSGFPLAGENAANTPFPKWRCIANVLLGDEPAEKCNGLLNRSAGQQRNLGFAGQASWFSAASSWRNQLTAGAAYDGNRVNFEQSTELGYLTPDRGVTGLGAFGDGVTGGEEDDEPFDVRVNMASRVHTGSLYATDTISKSNRLHLTMSGRFNRTVIDNRDLIRPQEGTGSLTGRHVFSRFNPAVGATFKAAEWSSFYGSYSEGSRAPSAIELGCADPNAPCRLPNSMAGDPPLNQVLTRTVEAGVRGLGGGVNWSAGVFRAANRDDILFVASEQTGFGYFKNFERTLRQGMELSVSARAGRVTFGGGYTLLNATFQSEEEVNGTGNSTNEDAEDGMPGMEGTIEIEPGNRIPLTPRHMLKAYADVQATSKLSIDLGVVGVGRSYARGNENNLHEPDGVYYLGPGESEGYVVANLGARYQVHRRVEFFGQVNNLFDKRYYSGAQIGPTGFTAAGSFVARPFAAVDGEFPVQQSTFFAPGAPRGAWGGIRVRF